MLCGFYSNEVSTHSRLKAAGAATLQGDVVPVVSTHSRLKAAGSRYPNGPQTDKVSTHSRLKAAGYILADIVFLV